MTTAAPSDKKILVVGDGDLSYSAALCQKEKEAGSGVCVWGSVLPSRTEQVRLYGKKVVEEREKTLGGKVLFEVDLTNFVVDGGIGKFDEVHFNYPHLGYSQQAERGGEWSRASQHVKFFSKMFTSLRKVQDPTQKMCLTLTPTPPYSIKSVKQAAIEAGYTFTSEAPFDPAEYPGYHPAWGDDRDITKPSTSKYGEHGRRLVFENCCCDACGIMCKGLEQIQQHLKSSKHERALRKRKSAENAKKPKRSRVVYIVA